jgi:uncharacterized repeat protein (TIGR03806 family)
MDLKYLRILSMFHLVVLVACGGGSGGKSSTPNSNPNPSSQVPISSSPQTSLAASSSSASQEVMGMDSRPSNSSCLAPEIVADSSAVISWKSAFPKLPVISKVAFLFQLPDDNTHWYIARQSGFITRFDNNAEASQITDVLDIDDRVDSSGNEMGLLSAVPHPKFAENRYVFLYYTARNSADDIETRVARYTVGSDGIFDKNSELLILSFTRPYANHVGGDMAFDKNGFLFITSGDGGSAGDPHENGQKLSNLLGKILRIDVDKTSSGKNYAIPSDNPFINTANAQPEIWAYGLRNPWRFSFDKTTNDLWVGDVGQDAWEEINLVARGGNYGWGDMEGNSCLKSRPDCSTANKIKPILPISHETGVCSVIGGYVYRGKDNPAAVGKYFYTDYCERTMRSLTRSSGKVVNQAEHGTSVTNIVSFAQDNRSELFALGQGSVAGQQIYKMEATGAKSQMGSMANKLSETGCVDAANPTRAAGGLIPYQVNSALWSDGAEKERYLSIPDNTQVNVTTNGDFNFPVGSVLMKHFKFGEKFVETRLFTHGELGWQGFSYEWNDAQTDANLLSGAKDKAVNNISWHFPSPGQCMECHTTVAGFSLGLEAKQLNGSFVYPASQKMATQLTTLSHIGLFAVPLLTTHKTEKLFSLDDVQATVEQKARSYLHTNCSNCHQPDGPTPVTLDLRFTTSLAQMNACNQTPTAGDVGIVGAKLIAPGDPSRSVLLKRMQATDTSRMPPLATSVVDTAAVQVISDWIVGLTGCE